MKRTNGGGVRGVTGALGAGGLLVLLWAGMVWAAEGGPRSGRISGIEY